MTHEELRKYRRELPISFPMKIEPVTIEDEYGVYATGLFEYKGKSILVTIDNGHWHISADADHPVGYYELKDIRYRFSPDSMAMAQIFPPREEFVNIRKNCYHLYELKYEDAGIDSPDSKGLDKYDKED